MESRASPPPFAASWPLPARTLMPAIWGTLFALSAHAQEYTVHDLTTGSTQCVIRALSDGRAVGYVRWPPGVGGDNETETHAFTWTEADGILDLGTLGGTVHPDISIGAQATAVDGDRVVGSSFIANNVDVHAFSWTPAEGLRDLGTLGGAHSFAIAVSGDEVVGTSVTASGEFHAFRWTPAGGMVDLGTLPRGTESQASSIHRGLVAGSSTTTVNGDETRHAVAWSAAGRIKDLFGRSSPLDGLAVSVRDGVVAGTIGGADLTQAFAWTAARGRVDLGVLPGFDRSFADDTSRGQVVGTLFGDLGGEFGDEGRPFSWTASGGMVNLGTLGGEAEGTHVVNGRVIGLYHVDPDQDPEIDFGNASTFLWTARGGMVHVRSRSRPVGIDAAGRIAVVDDVDVSEGASARSHVLVPTGADTDGDGVPNADDECPDSILSPVIVLDGRDTGVPNTVLPGGCTILDGIEECALGSEGHGSFVGCVARLVRELRRDGVITRRERARIQRAAAQSKLP